MKAQVNFPCLEDEPELKCDECGMYVAGIAVFMSTTSLYVCRDCLDILRDTLKDALKKYDAMKMKDRKERGEARP